MISIERIVSLQEFNELCRDSSYTKLEIRPRDMKNFRDIKVRCFYKVKFEEITSLKGMLQVQSLNPSLSTELREKIGGYYGNFADNNLWMGMTQFGEMVETEKKYNINLGIPKKFKKLYELLTTNIEDNA